MGTCTECADHDAADWGSRATRPSNHCSTVSVRRACTVTWTVWETAAATDCSVCESTRRSAGPCTVPPNVHPFHASANRAFKCARRWCSRSASRNEGVLRWYHVACSCSSGLGGADTTTSGDVDRGSQWARSQFWNRGAVRLRQLTKATDTDNGGPANECT